MAGRMRRVYLFDLHRINALSSCWTAFTWKPEEVRKTLEALRPRNWKCAAKIGEDDILKHDVEIYTLLRLIRAALHPDADQTVELDAECDVEKLAGIIVRQSLVTLVYPVIKRQTADGWQPAREKLKPVYEQEIHKGLVQEYEIQTLLDDLEKDGIDCLPMKGWIMRNYYPDPLMRSMCDLDVLLREMDSEKMRQWMEARGYAPEHIEQDVHDTYIKPPYMNIELHRRLMNETRLRQQHTDWRENWLASLWRQEYLLEGKKHIYRFSDEDFLVHHLLHFYKHFTESGVGVRPLADLYLFLQAKRQILQWEYLESQLDALHILTFSKRMMRLASQCFEDGELDSSACLVVEYMTRTGIYGDRVTMETSYLLRGENKVRGFFGRCFLPITAMKNIYPRLHRAPWLLPFYWAARIGRIVFLEPYKLDAMRNGQSKERHEQLERIYRAAGVSGTHTK